MEFLGVVEEADIRREREERQKKEELEVVERISNRYRSKAVLAALELIGFTGMDRIYLGCARSGFVKMLVFLIFIALFVSYIVDFDKNPSIGSEVSLRLFYTMSFYIFVVIWYLVDLFDVSVSILSGNNTPCFCLGYRWRVGTLDLKIAKILIWVILIITIGTLVYGAWNASRVTV
jgi:hypothetical protein